MGGKRELSVVIVLSGDEDWPWLGRTIRNTVFQKRIIKSGEGETQVTRRDVDVYCFDKRTLSLSCLTLYFPRGDKIAARAYCTHTSVHTFPCNKIYMHSKYL